MPNLILIKSPGGTATPQTFPLNAGQSAKTSIGRQKTPPDECDIVIDDGKQAISRKHAVIHQGQGKFFVESLGRNGTLLNNKLVEGKMPIKHEDRLKICDFLFRFQDESLAAPVQLPDHLRPLFPEVGDAEPTGEMTTIQHTVNRNAAQQFLEVQPTERLRALLEISTSLSKTLELEPLLPQILDTLFGVFKQADRCFVIQLDDVGRPYAKAFKARRSGMDDRFSKTIVRRCLEKMQAYLSEDASSDIALGAAQSIAEFRIRSVMCVPLATSDGKPLGALQLDTQDITKKFREDDLKLLTIVGNLASVAVEKAQNHAMLILREKAQREIELAKQVQLGFLPQTLPQVPGYEFFGFYSAAQTIGGDYYDFIPLPGNLLAVVLGDVAGKGVPAALLMAKLSAEARFSMLTQPEPHKAIGILNNQLFRGIGDRFVTLAALVLNPVTHQVIIVNAGHVNPLRYKASNGEFLEAIDTERTGLPLGVMEGFEFESVTITLEPGDTLTIFTDGVSDAMSPDGELFEMERVTRAVVGDDSVIAHDTRPKAIGERLVAAVRKHAAGRAQNDDIALVCFGRVDPPSGSPTGTSLNARTAD